MKVLTDFPDRFFNLSQVCLNLSSEKTRIFDIRSVRLHKGQALLKLVGIDNIEQAEAWRGAKIQISRDDAVELPEDNYYKVDLEGMDVVTKSGRVLGKLVEVMSNPGHDLLRVGDILVPAVKQIVVDVNVVDRIITIDPPEGMLPDIVEGN